MPTWTNTGTRSTVSPGEILGTSLSTKPKQHDAQPHSYTRRRPSHGRGRRFNPYSAHHFSTTYRQLPAVAGRTSRKHARSTRGESVDSVRGLSAQRPSALSASAVTCAAAPRLRDA